jgi:hypothetical protein
MNELTGWQSQAARAGVVTLFLLAALVACNRSNVHRVVVVYPESWPSGEYRNCYLGGSDPEHPNIPMIDCDANSRDTPRRRMLVMDVKFDGVYKISEQQAWTCQKRMDAELVCRR